MTDEAYIDLYRAIVKRFSDDAKGDPIRIEKPQLHGALKAAIDGQTEFESYKLSDAQVAIILEEVAKVA